jgi:hypothetical protein
MAGAIRFSHYGSDAGFVSPCLSCCEKEASMSAARTFVHAGDPVQVGKWFRRIEAAEFIEIRIHSRSAKLSTTFRGI